MNENVSDLKGKLDDYMDYMWDGFTPEVQTSNTIQIVLLRRTKSYNIFTTEGQELNITNTPTTIDGDDNIDRVVMFKRKQVASERRTGKEILRSLDLVPVEESEEDDYPMSEGMACRLHDNLCQNCIDCKLYGFAASGGGNSRSSRVLTDSAFTLRDIEIVRDNLTLNAQSEEHEAESSAALSSRSHTIPETYIPSVITLKDVTWRELVWMINVLQKTTRYGAETSRTGYLRNHILLVRFGLDEPVSNLELTQETTKKLENYYEDVAFSTEMKSKDVLKSTKDAAKDLIDKFGTGGEMMKTDELEEFIESVNSLAENEGDLREFLKELHEEQLNNERKES